MSFNVNDIYEFCKFLTNKNQSGNISSGDLFNAWNIEQNMYYQDIVGRWQARANGKQGANTGLIRNETILSELAPFTIPVDIIIAAGKIDKPVDFVYTNDLTLGGVKITHMTNDQLPAVNKSVIDPPSVTDQTYYYTEYENYYYLLPQSLTGTIRLSYIGEPTNIVWGFTFDADGRQVYDPTTSVQPKWDTPTVVTITKRALVNFGVRFKDADFANFGRTAQATGS